MNEHIEKIVEEKLEEDWVSRTIDGEVFLNVSCEEDFNEFKDFIRTARQEAYNAGLERAREIAEREASDPPLEETNGFIEGCHAVMDAIEKEKIENCQECQFEEGHSFECTKHVPIHWGKRSPN